MPTDYVFPFRLEEVRVLEAAMQANPGDARAPYYLGNLLYDRRPDVALEEWEKSAAIDGSFSLVHRNLAQGYEQVQNDTPKAIASMERAVALDPNNARLRFELDMLYEAGNVSPQKRLASFESNPTLAAKRSDAMTQEAKVYLLKHFHLLCSVSGAKKEAFAVCGGNGLEGLFRCLQQLFFGPGSVAAQDLFDLAPHGLDGIEVRRIRRQIQQPGAGGGKGFPDSPDFVRGQIIQNHHLTGAQGGCKSLCHPSQKHFAVHGPFKKPRSAGTLQTNAGDQGARLIVSVRNARQESLPTLRTAPQARHLGVGSAFVHKHQMGRELGRQLLMPVRPFFGDVGTLLFGGDQSFF
jgi:hypothetical protein